MKYVTQIITATTPEIQQQAVNTTVIDYKEYIPASTEQYILDHASELGYASEDNPDGSTIWLDPSATNEYIHQALTSYMSNLDHYNEAVANFHPTFPDVIDKIIKGNYHMCSPLKLHPDGVSDLFPNNQLSFSSSGYVEPLTPPMRSYGLCKGNNIMGLDNLVQDFETMCRKLKATSQIVLIDMGASLDFHSTGSPIIVLLAEYEKFGFHFDHIYAFEITFQSRSMCTKIFYLWSIWRHTIELTCL